MSPPFCDAFQENWKVFYWLIYLFNKLDTYCMPGSFLGTGLVSVN